MANPAFLRRAINRAQRLSISDPFCAALHEHIEREAGLVRDHARDLTWVNHPDGPQVAVWLVEVGDGQ